MFLRIMGICFLVAGLAFFIFVPLVRLMGGIWMGVGILLLVIGQVMAAGVKHRQQLLQTGKAGTATILDVADTGVTINENPRVRLTVRIDSEGQSFQAVKAILVSRVSVPRVGDVYGVRYDPANPNDFALTDADQASSAAGAGAGAAASPAANALRAALADPAMKERLRNAQSPEEAREILRSVIGPAADSMQINVMRGAGATGGAPAAPAGVTDVAGQLEKLADLRDKGILSGSEFETQKRKLLGES